MNDAELKAYEETQLRCCSNSRKGRTSNPGRMGGRLVAAVKEAWPEFKRAGGPILDIGCGDGLGMETFLHCAVQDATKTPVQPLSQSVAASVSLVLPVVKGIEVTPERVEVARSFGLDVSCGTAEAALPGILSCSYEVFCSHTLEHTVDRAKALAEIWRIGRRLVWIAVPLEKNGTHNKAHFSPVRSLMEMLAWVPKGWEVQRLEQRFNLEPEGILVCKRGS